MTTDPQTDRPRALHLLEAADFLRDAHFRDGLSVQEIGTALRHMADAADPMVGSLARDGFGLDEIAAMPAAPVAAPPTGQADETTAEHHVVDGVKYLCHTADHYCPAEPHRLALSTALGLGMSAPWDAIRERAAELAAEERDEHQAQANLDQLAEDLAAAIASCPGRELTPNPCRCPCYGCKHHCGAHDPGRGADEEQQARPLGCGCPDEDAIEHGFGTADCTCIPFTRQTDPPRYLNRPTDTVDMISGWERGTDCPHHAPAVVAETGKEA